MFYFDKGRNTTHKIKYVFERDKQTHYVPRCGFATTFSPPKGSAISFLFSGCEGCKIGLDIDREKNRIDDRIRRWFSRLLELPERWKERRDEIEWRKIHKEEIENGAKLSQELNERLKSFGVSVE